MSGAARALAPSLALVLAACGARTALDVSELDAAVEVDAGDAGAFRSFPCRWFPEPAIELPLIAPTLGAASAELERLLFVGAHESLALTYLPRATPTPDRMFVVEPSGEPQVVLPRRGGWTLVGWRPGAGFCDVQRLSPELELESTTSLRGEGCAARAIDPDRYELRRALPSGRWSVAIVESDDGALRDVVAAALPGASATQGREGHVHLVTASDLDPARWEARARTSDGRELGTSWRGLAGSEVALAPDRLLGGAVLLAQDERGRWELWRLRVEGDALARERIAEIPGEPTLPLDLATNETEALFTLADGSFVAIPLHTGDVRVFDPPPDHEGAAPLVLAPGASVGGQLWAEGERVFFRSLTCNR